MSRHRPSTAPSGLVLVDKPQGWTSHQVVGRMRRLMGTRKVGHAGTLDPMATGLLIIGVEGATRLLGHIAGQGKTYTATIRLGQSTNTDDAEGEVTGQHPTEGLSAEAIAAAIVPLTGQIKQVPSSVSAIKVDGKRAYALVRAGEEVELKSRPVTVSRFDILDVRPGQYWDVDVIVDCSSGTYIRALARDLGSALGVGGHLTALRRHSIGAFALEDAVVDLDADDRPEVMAMGQAARHALPFVEVDQALATDIAFGRSVALDLDDDVTALIGPDDQLLALHGPDADKPGRTKPVAVFVTPGGLR